eukprot:g8933.t1
MGQPRSKIRNDHLWTKRFIGIGLGIGSSGFLPFDPLHLTAHAAWPWSIFCFSGNKSRAQARKRIMIMYSKTGGGHKASAEAIKSGFERIYKDKYDIKVVDIWTDHSPHFVSKMPEAYNFVVKYPWMYRLLYHFLNPTWMHVPYFRMLLPLCYNRCNEAFEIYKPDLVVSVHPLLQHIPIKILRDRIRAGVQKPIAFATVVTDYTTCHNSWFHKGVTQCFVPTEYCYNIGEKLGLKPSQLTLHGLPIRPEFAKHLPSRQNLRKKLNMLSDVPAALLVGGGEGMGSIEKTVHAVEKSIGAAAQLVVICGRNKDLQERLSKRQYPDGMHVVVQGFVNNMNEWMCACDVIITKAGPGTIAEALICGTPILLNGFIPGQEAGNIPYVTENRVGAYENNPDKIAAILKEWFISKKDELKEMSIKAKTLGRPEALERIVQDLAALCDQPTYNSYLNCRPRALLSGSIVAQGGSL